MKVAKELVQEGQRLPNGLIVIERKGPFVVATAQRQCDESEAATFCYLITNLDHFKPEPDFLKLIKHPRIKGSKAKKAIGG